MQEDGSRGTAQRATEELTTAHNSARSSREITACKVNEGERRAWVCRIRTGAPCGVSPRSNHTLTTLEKDRRRTTGAGLFSPSGRDVARAGFEPASPHGRRLSRCVCRRIRTITTSESHVGKTEARNLPLGSGPLFSAVPLLPCCCPAKQGVSPNCIVHLVAQAIAAKLTQT